MTLRRFVSMTAQAEILELARAHSAKISCMWLLVPDYQDERESRLQFELIFAAVRLAEAYE